MKRRRGKRNEDFYYTTRLGIVFLLLFLFMVASGQIKRDEPREIISPVPISQAKGIPEEVLPTPTPVLSERELVIQEIKDVFGEDSDKAIMILTHPDCHENLYLDPKAVNDNTFWGGVGVDRGVFQINSYYHPECSEECVFDYKCNIRCAYKIFKERGNFSAWVCGRELNL